jgi:PAS domain S-box-containing protein
MAITRAADGRILDVNDRWQRLFGWRRREALERDLLELLGIAEPMRARIEERLRSRSAIHEQEIEARTRSGETVQAIVAMEAVEMVGEHSFVLTVRDITAQRRAELEAREQRLELTHLSRVNLLGELSGAIAHELNQPLTAILSNADAAQRYLARGAEAIPQVREILQEIAEADQRAARVIRRLRDLMRKGEGQFGPLELNGILEEVLEIAHSELITRSVAVDVRLDDRLPPIHGDRVQLQQLYLNLVGNACEAMQSVERSERRLSLASLRADGGAVRAVVADGGPGIASEKLREVFEPFVTSKTGGLGLGLAICRTIMTAHGGRIWAENGSNRGATIVTEFPARPTPVEAARS